MSDKITPRFHWTCSYMETVYIVQGFSLRRGHFVTLFAPYATEMDACRMRDDLRKRNPQITYRVICRQPKLYPVVIEKTEAV